MPNMGKIMAGINKSKLNEKKDENRKNENQCSRQGLCAHGCILHESNNCKIESVVYKATCIDEDNVTKKYVGMTEDSFKNRVQGHYTSFNNPA